MTGAPSLLRLGLRFEWVAERSALHEVSAQRLSYCFRGFDYAVQIANGVASKTGDGVSIIAVKTGVLRLQTAQ